jgi:uncharacterized membrane protein
MSLAGQSTNPQAQQEHGGQARPFPAPHLIALLAALATIAFLIAMPDGLLGAANMIAYAVCHRIASHSLVIGGRQLPLCARCTGTFSGALIGLLGQSLVLRRGKASRFPPTAIIVLTVLFIATMAADGLNSYISLIPNAPYLYEPRNWLRLLTGSLNGLAMSTLIYPIFNATLWLNPTEERTIRDTRDLIVLLALNLGAVALVLTGWFPLLYPIALASVAGILTLLTAINTMIFAMIIRRENVVENWRQAVTPVLAGLTISLFQIGAIDLLRFALTGTLDGIPTLQ